MSNTRLIKKYANRKMYDTLQKDYVNLVDLEMLIVNNVKVRVIEVETGLDITGQTLLQVIANNPMNAQNVKELLNVIKLKKLR